MCVPGDLVTVVVSMQGRTELHGAAERGDVQEVQRLITTSVDINSRTDDVRHYILF